MTRTQRIKRIVGFANAAERAASQRLSGCRNRHESTLARLEEFRSYRAEYSNALADGAGMSAARARELRRFIEQLDRSITALESNAAADARACDAELEKWQRETRRKRALGDVLERAARAECRAEEHRSQCEADDRAQRPTER